MIRRRRRVASPSPPKWRHNHWPARSVQDFVISFPKSGRTWLRVMLAIAVAETRGEPARDVVSEWLGSDAPTVDGRPILFTHALSVPAHEPSHAIELYLRYVSDRRRLFLFRDPRDTVVSHYFQVSRRARRQPGYESAAIGDFVRDPERGIDRILAFFRACDDALRAETGPSLVLAYEDLHRDPATELHAALEFFGISADERVIDAAVEFGRFENMRSLERDGAFALDNRRLGTRNPDDPESFKTRKGAVGGYREYLSDADVEYVEARIAELLPIALGYREAGVPASRVTESIA
jgi:hypothetical protein